MQKFENIDLVSALERIMKANTEYYQTDFNYDKSILQRAANSNKAIDKSLLWLSRKHGTNCVFESDAYIKNSPSNTTWKYFADQKSENVLSYALTVTEIKDGRIYGNLYELDYAEHIGDIRKNQVKADDQIIHFEHGDIKTDFGKMPSATDKLGEPVEVEYIPNEPEKLESVLKHQQEERKKLPAGDIEKYLSSFDIKVPEFLSEKKPSIRKQLAKNKEKTADAPKKPSKNRTKDLEV